MFAYFLPQQECSKSRKFLKNLKVTQGCLERKTIDEIKIINEFGQIIIGKESSNLAPSEVITVKVIPGKNHPSKEYTYQELQDLISRIVLITGKGKTENQIGLMHKYLEVSAIYHLKVTVKYLYVWEKLKCTKISLTP